MIFDIERYSSSCFKELTLLTMDEFTINNRVEQYVILCNSCSL